MILWKVSDLIGNTPMLGIPVPDKDSVLMLKVEKNNPGGSMKDRMARNMGLGGPEVRTAGGRTA
ncbi:hypothetical protein ACTMU2_11725 [Cupriavidus basilensis]